MLIRPGAIGDFVLSLPALEHLKSDYTEVWCAESNVSLATFADAARSIGSSGLDRVGILPDSDVRARLQTFDQIHSWYGAARPDFRSEVSGFPFHFYEAIPSIPAMPATEFYCRQVGAPTTLPRLDVEGKRESFCALHPFASNPAKRWPLAHFRRLAALLGDVRWCAGPEEVLPGAVGIPNLLQLARWLATARLFIGNDSGITHLAAAAGTPTVAIFGPTDPAVWAPRGQHVRVIRRSPLQSLEPEEVFALARTLL